MSRMDARVEVDVVRLVVPLSRLDYNGIELLSPVIIVFMQYVNNE